jgi:multidrug efflux system outer membrane protein
MRYFRALGGAAGRAGLMAALLAGCAVGPDYEAPSMDLPGGYSLDVKAGPADLTFAQWWTGFRDPALNRLVDRGLAQNLSILQAMERVRAAEAQARATGVQLTADASLTAERSGSNETVEGNEATGTFGVSWLVDLFGGQSRSREAAGARLDAAYADVGVARTVFLSALVSAYVDLRFFEARLALAERDLNSRRRTVREVQTLLDAGNATQLDLAQSEALISSTQAQIPVLQASADAQRNRIATLLGVPAATLDGIGGSAGQPQPADRVRVGVPADLVRNRPDVRRAERAYAAQVADIGVAVADLYPSLRLNGNIEVGRIPGNEAVSWGFGPVLSIPIFAQGARKAQVNVEESQARESYLAWKLAVLTGVEEVESSLTSLGRSSEAVAAARRAASDFERALDLSRTLAQNQQATILDVLNSERSVSDARATLAQNVRQLALDYVRLNVALGAGSGAGPAEIVSRSLEAPAAPVAVAARHRVAAGETLTQIAATYGTTVQGLAEANGLQRPFEVAEGTVLKLPLQ